jgi:hypothetical protein
MPPERPTERAAQIAARTRRSAQDIHDAAERAKAAIEETRELLKKFEVMPLNRLSDDD